MFAEIENCGHRYRIVDLGAMDLGHLPVVHRVLIENLIRHGTPFEELREWIANGTAHREIAFRPGRILMHDTTCGPALVDLAAARSAIAEAGGDPARINPVLRVDVSTDHSLAVDRFGDDTAMAHNMRQELARNHERYRFMRWASQSLNNFTVHPPGTGIMHTINLERLAMIVQADVHDDTLWAFPDTLIGTDSHTPMINGIGVLGWGVGGLEAESVMLGQPVALRVPEVIGVRLTGRSRDGLTATDLALAVTHRLRQMDLSGKFVEFFGPGVSTLSAGTRSTVANMAPEYGASTGYFPVDDATLSYLRQTGRGERAVQLVETYTRNTGLWFDPAASPTFGETLEIDLGALSLALAGPKRPQDLVQPAALPAMFGEDRSIDGALPTSPVALAAITSCTNTSDPRLLIAAGLLARKARSYGLEVPDWVKTSLAPGSPTALRILQRAGLMDDLAALGFDIVGYGCTACIGNSGELTDAIVSASEAGSINPVAVLSGNRNFPGRVHPRIENALLASPPLVVAFALAGVADIDITQTTFGSAPNGSAIRLSDLWPTDAEIDAACASALSAQDYAPAYDAAEASADWQAIEAPDDILYDWDADSTYLRRPPFVRVKRTSLLGSYRATPLLVLGDDVTTDHISPAGAIPPDGEAGNWLVERGEDRRDLNVFSSRRGNWEVMMRGLFTNRSVRNHLAPDIPPGSTIHAPTGDILPIWKAACRYAAEERAVVLLAGDRYGTGSSRDWAAKGASLLGVRAVLATGFERIHRSNLVNMGILPLMVPADFHPARLGLSVKDTVQIDAPAEQLAPRKAIQMTIERADGSQSQFKAIAAIETDSEVDILRAGGLIPKFLSEQLTPVPA